jgi:hypothetical protein
MTARTASDLCKPWLQPASDRVEQVLQATGSPDDGGTRPLPEAGNDAIGARAGQSGNPLDRRAKTDRRVLHDRRQMIRFEDDRRTGVDRRAGSESLDVP